MLQRKITLKDGSVVRAKFTVEERSDGTYIQTSWTPNHGSYVDREVTEFETYSAALSSMYECALDIALQHTNLSLSEEGI